MQMAVCAITLRRSRVGVGMNRSAGGGGAKV